MNPFADGKRHEMGMDLFVKGFTAPDLITAYHRLTADHEQERLILETACIDEIDDEYNDGETIYPDDDIFEAVTVRRFSQTDSRMKALSRVFTKHLDDGITPGEAIIGKPKKSGLFATVTAQIPFSDGQVISIVFHSPDGNAKQIKPDDAIIAFRWLLNKRDITHVVSPEGEGEVSLEEVGKRIAQLVQKNSARFQTTQKEVKEQRENLETLKTEAGNLEAINQQTMDTLRGYQEDIEDTQVKIDRFRGLVERQKEINADLENRLAGLRASKEAEAARAEAERVAVEEDAAKNTEIKALQEEAISIGMDADTLDYWLKEGTPDDLRLVIAKKREQNERDAEEQRLEDVGKNAIPGINPLAMKGAGILWEKLQRDEITKDEWDMYVEDLYNRRMVERPEPPSPEPEPVPEPEPEIEPEIEPTPEPEPVLEPEIEPAPEPVEPETTEPAAVTIANDIISGKYDDLPLKEILNLSEQIWDLDESVYLDLMTKADAHLTKLTREAAMAVA